MLFFNERDILVDEIQLTKVIKILDNNGLTWESPFAHLRMGNCGWKKAPSCWFVNLYCTDGKWARVLKEFKENGIHLLPETTGY
jgi:hypothetical protein